VEAIIAQFALGRKLAAGERFSTRIYTEGHGFPGRIRTGCRKKRKKAKNEMGRSVWMRFHAGTLRRREDKNNLSETSAALRHCVRFNPFGEQRAAGSSTRIRTDEHG
jgi:hypothetical protein